MEQRDNNTRKLTSGLRRPCGVAGNSFSLGTLSRCAPTKKRYSILNSCWLSVFWKLLFNLFIVFCTLLMCRLFRNMWVLSVCMLIIEHWCNCSHGKRNSHKLQSSLSSAPHPPVGHVKVILGQLLWPKSSSPVISVFYSVCLVVVAFCILFFSLTFFPLVSNVCLLYMITKWLWQND